MDWPHAPLHRCNDVGGIYFITGATLYKQHFRETELTYEQSWLARLKYTHENAVHHRLVVDATRYRWCSAGWFEDNARASFVKTVRGVKIDRVNVYDDFAALLTN